MVRTRSQLENLSKEELIEELITVEDISSKLSDLSNRFNDFLRRFEVVSSDIAIARNCNKLTIIKLQESSSVGKECSYKCSVPLARISGGKPCHFINQ